MNKNGFVSTLLLCSFLVIFLFLMTAIINYYNQKNIFQESIDTQVNHDLYPFPKPKDNLEKYTWAEIKRLSVALATYRLSKEELKSKYHIEIGSIKNVKIKSEDHPFRLVGINHDVDINNQVIGMTFEQVDLFSTEFEMMNEPEDEKITQMCGSDLEDDIEEYSIPDVENYIVRAMKKYNSCNNKTNGYVERKLWLMSETEIAGTVNNSSIAEGKQYEYYQKDDSKRQKKYKQKGIIGTYDLPSDYWLRTFYKNDVLKGYHFAFVKADYSIPKYGDAIDKFIEMFNKLLDVFLDFYDWLMGKIDEEYGTKKRISVSFCV